MKPNITIETTVFAPADKVWEYWTGKDHICKWNNASEDWHTVYAENDLRPGGKFLSRMEAKDKSFGFDFGGVYDEVEQNKLIKYTLEDGRKVGVTFSPARDSTVITETFDPENTNSIEVQKKGWQNILDNFKRYAEAEKPL